MNPAANDLSQQGYAPTADTVFDFQSGECGVGLNTLTAATPNLIKLTVPLSLSKRRLYCYFNADASSGGTNWYAKAVVRFLNGTTTVGQVPVEISYCPVPATYPLGVSSTSICCSQLGAVPTSVTDASGIFIQLAKPTGTQANGYFLPPYTFDGVFDTVIFDLTAVYQCTNLRAYLGIASTKGMS
jgi:hypothetical protein